MKLRSVLLLSVALTACAPPPPVEQSREALWQQFGNHSLDEVLLAWGTPAGETKLTNGSRMVTYRHATSYDVGSPYERDTGCEVSFLAAPPKFRIENISMQGNGYECSLLAQGKTGYARNFYIPPPYPYPYDSLYFRRPF